jgi:Flp pilus assembly protein TadD
MRLIGYNSGWQRLIAAFFMLVFLPAGMARANDTGVAATPDTTKSAPSTMGETLAKPVITPGLAGNFLSSRFARHHQDLNEASKYLGETLARDPSNLRLIHETMRMNLLAGNTDEAISLAHRLQQDTKNDPLVATILMLEQVKKGDYKKARELVKAPPDLGLFGVIRPAVDQWLMINEGTVTKQADLQKAIDKSGFFAPFLYYHMALMNDVLGNEAAARASYLKASADPAITPYRVVEAFANFYARHGQWKEAQAMFDHYAQANPDSSLLPQKITPVKGKVEPLVGSANEGLAELFFTTASILFGEESSQETFLYLRISLALRPDLPPAQLMLANLYEQMQDYDAAIATYDAIAPGNVFYRRGQIRKALNYEAKGERPAAIKILRKLTDTYPDDNSALITIGDMQREDEKFLDAASAYTQAIARAEPLRGSDWPLLYARGISFERAGEWGKAEADFERALTLEPNQPDVLNYLAYSWLVMNKNVARAREYLEIAASARPDDAHIIDSLAWADYLAGDFGAAVDKLEKAAELMPDDPTVNDHLGDAYWRVGRKIEAKFQWQRALTFKPDQATAAIITKKLESGLAPFLDQQGQAVNHPAQTTATANVVVPFQTQVR